ncbi:DUF4440 domain-containing protein [Bacteriovorax sp. DB6_IX]|uniref:YybH family protein n=1 Tax=Bacteriovorax sp. DB6_IX TaxID=1353530 RepID=UPI000389FDDC|nr:DUF4440 domain-containing protein [Bacteriovorax sp. DB6_IX]EQC51290.1 SnoaL-like domain protein [Bacteriovorax sp. DB6_IX]
MKKILTVLLVTGFIGSTVMAGALQDILGVNQKIVDAVAQGDLDEVVSHYTVDTTFLAPQAPVLTGRDAVKAFYTGALAAGATALELESLSFEKISKRKYIEIGQNKIHFTDPSTGASFVQTNKYMVIWKKVRGNWQVYYDAYNALP